jgi:paraquat-inducible protein A
MRHPLPTALNSGLVGCGICHLLVPAPEPGVRGHCPRCGAALHQRKPNSLHRTWALVLAALIFYIPANVLPITVVTSLGMKQADTIMSGVIYFLHEGAWYISAVIFIASVFVPLMKLIILIYLLISVQYGTTARLRDRTRLYRITEAVGRWSMVDIFVVTILVALVNLGALATLQAGPAAPFFAAVVVVTMTAAMSFDPRLIWDAKEQTQ